MGQHDYSDVSNISVEMGLIEMAESKLSDEMLSINKEIIKLNGRLRRCLYEKSCLEDKRRKLNESVKPPYFFGG